MKEETIQSLVGNTDIYLLDQIMKERYKRGESILDAGCGEGRNLHWFLKNDFKIFGVDQDENSIINLRKANPDLPKTRFSVAAIQNLHFKDNYFDHVISSAVLHFATGHAHFKNMIKEMRRVLKTGGTLFIRMTTNRGIEHLLHKNKNGIYDLPDGSERYLITSKMLEEILYKQQLSLVEPFKTVVVDDKRSMCILLLRKEKAKA